MKKIKNTLAATVAIATLAISSANANTEGLYVGANIARNHSKFDGGKDTYRGYGANVKYAFNKNNVFIAPVVFFDRIDNKVLEGGNENRAAYRYGAKLDIGYDITRDFGVYVTGGGANVKYKSNSSAVGGGKNSDDQIAAVYGVGAKYALTNNLGFTFEYNRQSRGKFKDSSGLKTPSEVNSAQFGVALNF